VIFVLWIKPASTESAVAGTLAISGGRSTTTQDGSRSSATQTGQRYAATVTGGRNL
jgi:hypothetical protein